MVSVVCFQIKNLTITINYIDKKLLLRATLNKRIKVSAARKRYGISSLVFFGKYNLLLIPDFQFEMYTLYIFLYYKNTT